MTVMGWWFGDTTGRLGYNDGRKIKIGVTHKVDGPIIPCQLGLHASPTVLDALQYARGPVLYRVSLSGIVVPHGSPCDKWAASERSYVDGGDASDLLKWFARACAVGVLRYWNAPQTIKDYLQTDKESLRNAAWSAAQSAAQSARSARSDAWSAAWSAAWFAAWSAERSSAQSAAWSSAQSAAWSAAQSAARSAAWSAQSAAWSAAWYAARSAAWSTQKKWLEAAALQWIGEQPRALDDLRKSVKK